MDRLHPGFLTLCHAAAPDVVPNGIEQGRVVKELTEKRNRASSEACTVNDASP